MGEQSCFPICFHNQIYNLNQQMILIYFLLKWLMHEPQIAGCIITIYCTVADKLLTVQVWYVTCWVRTSRFCTFLKFHFITSLFPSNQPKFCDPLSENQPFSHVPQIPFNYFSFFQLESGQPAFCDWNFSARQLD